MMRSRHWRSQALLALIVLACVCAPVVLAQAPADQPGLRTGETFEIAAGVTETVDEIMERERLLPPYAVGITIKEELPSGFPKRPNPDAPAVSSWPPREKSASVVPDLLRPLDPRLPQTVGVNFNAIVSGESGFIPPDSMGDVGPTQVLVVANGRIKVFDKAGVLGPLDVSTNTFFQSVRVGGTSDPHIRYDRLTGRWFVVMIDVGACGNQVLMAVSSGPVITGTASFTFFRFVGEPNGTNPHFTDYPTLGVDRNALYIGGNMFDVSQVGCAAPFDPVNVTVWVVNKASLISGGPATVTAFRSLVNYTSGVGTWTAQGVDNDDPAASEGYFLGVDFFAFSRLNLFRVGNPGGVPPTPPTLSAQINLTVPTTVLPQSQPQPSGGPTLDALDDRLFAAAVHRNKIANTLSLWSAHNIEVDGTGVANVSGNRNGSRWYQISNLTGAPVVTQSGTLFDASATTPFGYWIPSIMMSGQGHAAIASSRASTVNPTGFASITAAGRLRGDALGSIQAPTLVRQSASGYDQNGGPPERWGDYSQTVVDPNDDQTMWTFQEWASAVNTWGLNVTQLRAPPPATPATATPNTVSTGQSSINVVIAGTSSAGSEFFDPGPDTGGPGFANRIISTVSGSVTVNTITFNTPTQVTLNISTVGTPAGLKDVTVTNPDGQGAIGIGLINVVGCPTITVNPATVPGGTVGTAYSQTFTQTGGAAPVTFGLAGTLPTGITFNAGTATISGTPTQTGSFPFTVTATDANNCTGNRGYTLVIGCQTITVNPTTIPAGTAGTAYSQTFTQTGGIGTITWSVTGTLPTGVTLNPSTGVLSGTPTQTGSFPITIVATDGNLCTGSRAYTLVINCQTITVNPTTIPAGTAGTAYSQTFTQTGGIGTITWSVTGTLPTGVTLNPSTGVLSGTPTQTGSFPITIVATDGNLCTGSRAYTLVINCQTITVNPTTIPAGTAGTAYSQTFTQTSGIGTITWSVTGTLPTGVTLNPSTGVLSGTPTQTGSFPITIVATDGNLCTGSRAYTLVINCQTITVNPTTIPAGTAGTAYSQTFTQTSGIGTITWSVTGTLPTGVTLNPSTGVLSGTPTQTGSFPITIVATDGNLCTGSRAYTLVINCQTITVNPTTIPAGTAGTAYSQTFTQTSGIGTIAWSVTGTLPTGVTLNPSTGVLSGTPTQTGSFPITIVATDGNLCTGSRAYTLVINCQTITVNPTTIPNGTVGTPYSQTFTQTSGIGTITWSVTGTLPTGVTLNPSTGVLSGTPTQGGSFPITITATDGNACVGSRGYTLVIDCGTMTVNPTTIPNGTAGTAYSQTFTQTGGVGTITWSVTGTLPTGLTLNPSTGVLSGTPTQTGSFPITVSATDGNGCIGSRAYTLVINCQTITVNPTTIPAGTAGVPYSQAFTQTSGIGTITWSVTGTLPAGVTLGATTGVLSGTPTQIGSFPITINATDGNGCIGSRPYTLVVNAAGPFVATALVVDQAGNQVFEAGETAVVAPTWRNDTGAPQPLTGTASLFTGPGTSTYTITDSTADYGAVVAAGAASNCSPATGNCYGFSVSVPATRPSVHWDSTFRETLSSADARTWTLHLGDSFTDVPRSSPFYRFIETLLHKQITGGCGPTTYCPGGSTLREQMAVFVLVAKEGPGYLPPACATPVFADVPASSPYCRFIEELARRNVVSGCGGGNYCPSQPVTREQMSVFVLRTLDPTLNPPACTTPVFSDVPASNPFCRWIEELVRRGVVTGCGTGIYCPTQPVTREQMGVFISVTFGLTLYGP